MISKTELINLFFHDLKSYNTTNFRSIESADVSKDDPVTLKSFSSVITRYFIFCEKHSELSESEKKLLYFQLKLDMIARYFSNYPDNHYEDLQAFQSELVNYAQNVREEVS